MNAMYHFMFLEQVVLQRSNHGVRNKENSLGDSFAITHLGQ